MSDARTTGYAVRNVHAIRVSAIFPTPAAADAWLDGWRDRAGRLPNPDWHVTPVDESPESPDAPAPDQLTFTLAGMP